MSSTGVAFPGSTGVRVFLEAALDDLPAATSPTWTDLSDWLIGFAVHRGRQTELDQTEAGTLTVELRNDDRRFDPSYSLGDYYGKLLPVKKIRLRAVYSDSTYHLFTGYVESWPQSWQGNLLGTVSLQAVDGFKALNLSLLNTSFPAQRSDLRLAAVLDAVGWSADDRALSTGISTFQASPTLQNVAALSHLQTAAQSENGLLYMTGSGAVRFIDRHSLQLTTAAVATFGDAAGELPYADLTDDYSDGQIWNEIRVTRENGTEQAACDSATSQAKYFSRTLTRSGLFVDTDNEAAANAEYLLNKYKDPALRLTGLVLNPLSDATLWPQVLGREIGDRVTVKRRPGGGSASETIVQPSFIEGVDHAAALGGVWQTQLRMSAAGAEGSVFILDDATQGKLDGIGRLVY